MSEASKPVPPVPDAFPVLREDLGNRSPGKLTSHHWSRWFLTVRAKVNAINEALVNLGIFAGTGVSGLLVLDNSDWKAITITGTSGRVTVANGNGLTGNPIINTEGNVRSVVGYNLTVDDTDPENVALSVPWEYISAIQTSPRWVPAPLSATSPGSVGDIAMDSDYLYTCEGDSTWKRTPRSTW